MQVHRILPTGILLLAVLAATSVEAASRQMLRHRLDALTEALQSIDRLPATNRLHAAICLPLRNPAGLTNLLSQIYDPASSSYRHYLTPDEFTERFGPTKEDYAAVVAFAQAQGLTVTATHPNRLLVDVGGSAADFEHAFHTNLRLYRHPRENRNFYAPDTAPSIDLTVPVLSVHGLDNYAVPHPAGHRPRRAAQATPLDGSGPSGNLMGSDFRKAYAPGATLTGAGQSVGLVEFDGYYASDIATYASQAGISSVPLHNVLIDGFNGTPITGPYANNSEVAMDIELVIAMAPGLNQVLVYEAGPSAAAIDILNRMATDNTAKQLSASWTWITLDPGTDQVFQEFAAQGQSFFNASGDNDAYDPSTNPVNIWAPADDPYITIVGGTTLTTGSSGAWASETAWNWGDNGDGTASGTSGGISTTYPIPAWQQGVSMSANKGSTTMRNIPDVAMAADNIWAIYDNGSSGAWGGTSASSPLWAAFTALINQQAVARGSATVGFLNPTIYALGAGALYSVAFHDTATGNNTWSGSSSKFYAVSGYDLCTGWGTPAGQPLIDALAEPLGVTPTGGTTSSGPVGGPFSVSSQTYVLANSSATSLNWRCSTTAPWLTPSATSGTLPANGSVSVTLSLNAAASNLTTGVYSNLVYFADLNTATVQTRSFSLQVGQPLLQNSGFETGNFTGWTWSGNTTYTIVSSSSPYVHSGTYGAKLGPSDSLGYLSQSLATVAGQSYLISFWLYNANGNNSPNNEFQVSWNGTALFDQTNIGTVGWTNIQLVATATNATTVLQFGFYNDPVFFGFDDVSVTAVATNASTLLTLTVQSNQGGASPGSTTVLSGAILAEQIVNSPVVNGATQYVCTGATVIGNDCIQIRPTCVLLTLTNDATLTWNWQTQYRLTTAVSGNGTVTPGGWQTPGTSVVLTATAGSTAHFTGWSGQTNGCLIAGNVLTAPMTQARSITAVFASGALPVISGKVTKSGSTNGVGGVTITFSNNVSTITITTDGTGSYSNTVPYKWSGTATASFTNGGFATSNITYSALTANQTGKNYVWTPSPVISGKVTKSGSTNGVPGVTIAFSAIGTTNTDVNGNYSLIAPYNWKGTATPSTNGIGGAFSPTSKAYSKLVANSVAQNYTWTPPPIISGKVTRTGSTNGVAGIVLTFSGVGTTTTDTNGAYTMTVPYSWAGSVTPSSMSGGSFSPASKSYSKLIANKAGQNFTWTTPAVRAAVSLASSAESVSLAAPVVLLRTFGAIRWSGTNAEQVLQAPELLSIAVNAGMPKVTLPTAVATPDDLSATVTIEPMQQGVVESAGAPAVIVRNAGGTVTADTLLPGDIVLGSVIFVPVADTVVLTWDLSVLKP
jgi:hypothetical protein